MPCIKLLPFVSLSRPCAALHSLCIRKKNKKKQWFRLLFNTELLVFFPDKIPPGPIREKGPSSVCSAAGGSPRPESLRLTSGPTQAWKLTSASCATPLSPPAAACGATWQRTATCGRTCAPTARRPSSRHPTAGSTWRHTGLFCAGVSSLRITQVKGPLWNIWFELLFSYRSSWV